MIVAVPWRKDEGDEKVDGEGLQREVVLVDPDYKERLEMDEHVPVSKKVHI